MKETNKSSFKLKVHGYKRDSRFLFLQECFHLHVSALEMCEALAAFMLALYYFHLNYNSKLNDSYLDNIDFDVSFIRDAVFHMHW